MPCSHGVQDQLFWDKPCPFCMEEEKKVPKMTTEPPAGAPSTKYNFTIIRHPDDCQNWDNEVKVFHDKVIDAEEEAKRLSVQHMNTRFCVAVIYEHFIAYPKTVMVSYEPD